MSNVTSRDHYPALVLSDGVAKAKTALNGGASLIFITGVALLIIGLLGSLSVKYPALTIARLNLEGGLTLTVLGSGIASLMLVWLIKNNSPACSNQSLGSYPLTIKPDPNLTGRYVKVQTP